MLPFFSAFFLASASEIKQHAFDRMISISEEAINLVENYTNMTVLDTKVFEDQIHILVDSISHEFGDEFDLLMGELANSGHISMISEALGMSWPMEPFHIYEHFMDSEKLLSNTEVDDKKIKRGGGGGQRRMKNFSQEHCGGAVIADSLFGSGACYGLPNEGAYSSSIENNAGYSMHISHYVDRRCTAFFKAGYYWLKGHTTTCYKDIRGESSFWWDWPGHRSP